jgi:hypothetical protein
MLSTSDRVEKPANRPGLAEGNHPLPAPGAASRSGRSAKARGLRGIRARCTEDYEHSKGGTSQTLVRSMFSARSPATF